MSGKVMSYLMIDTVVLTMPNADKIIWEPDLFTPSLRGVSSDSTEGFGAKLFNKYTYNIPSKLGYFPRLTVTPRWNHGLQIPLRIEFSVPKLVLGNNLDELEEKDWDRVITTLKSKLSQMGVKVFSAQLENAAVSAVHFSKNIVLTDHYTATMAIKTLGKLDVSKRLDLNHRHFQNDGHALYFDCGYYQIVLYDKIQDITKSKRHSVDQDKIVSQLQLFEQLLVDQPNLEVLRFEIRITKKPKLNSIFTKLGHSPNPTFKQVFSQSISQQILKDHWDMIANPKGLFLLKFTDEDVLRQVLDYQKNSGKKLSTIESLGLAQMIGYAKEHGLRGLRTTMTSLYSERTWFRMSKYFSQIEAITASKQSFRFVKDVEASLNDFQPYRVAQSITSSYNGGAR